MKLAFLFFSNATYHLKKFLDKKDYPIDMYTFSIPFPVSSFLQRNLYSINCPFKNSSINVSKGINTLIIFSRSWIAYIQIYARDSKARVCALFAWWKWSWLPDTHARTSTLFVIVANHITTTVPRATRH